MPYTTILFYALALIIVVSAVMVVFNKNVVHSAFSLFFTLFAISGIYVLLKADFIALTQIMVYVGGILILLIFGVMMTTKVTNVELKTKNLNTIPSLVFSIGIVTVIIFIIFSTKWNIRMGLDSEETVTQIGIMLLSKYLLPFEIASIVLLVALIGSAMFARRIKD
ncbi:MAG TPA: NADH-quinone oxidoreductase subunit J [Ignavibacteria bacterium]|nr:NADH-quinone oxidoreductase subunit J [Ignavibacteria bacterium]